ncbi:MAG: hypothetical protein IPQ10_03140 [Saprospiraceae bacterium]|nr:hypothetical protein [Saprospiraceae bacterium]MBK7796544.1 hypothetical protein [Saprospiraceae bacterium]MBL0260066.1 hypothetical protein [Saprospiraceae bacterium]
MKKLDFIPYNCLLIILSLATSCTKESSQIEKYATEIEFVHAFKKL